MASGRSVGGSVGHGPATAFRGMLEEKLRDAGIRFPAHSLLTGLIVNAMALLVSLVMHANYNKLKS